MADKKTTVKGRIQITLDDARSNAMRQHAQTYVDEWRRRNPNDTRDNESIFEELFVTALIDAATSMLKETAEWAQRERVNAEIWAAEQAAQETRDKLYPPPPEPEVDDDPAD